MSASAFGPCGVARRPFHDHVVLVQLARRSSPPGAGRRRCRARCRSSRELRPRRDGAVAVDLDAGLDAVVLLVGVDVGQRRLPASSPRPAASPSGAGRRGCRSSACTGRCELLCAAARAHVLHRVEEDAAGRSPARAAGAAARSPPGRARCARDAGLRLTNMKPPPARPPPVKPTTVSTAGSRRMMSTTWRSFSPHRLRRDALVGAQAALELAGVLLREEALGRGAEQIDVEADHRDAGSAAPASALASAQSRLSRTSAARAAKPRSAQRASRPGGFVAAVARPARSSQAHIIGVVVSEMTSEISTAADSVTANSRNSRPTWPAHEQQRDEHRDQRDADREHGEADLAARRAAPPASGPCRPRCGGWCSRARRSRRRRRSRWRP